MHYDDVRPLLLQAQDRGTTAVRGAVVDDPEDPTSTAVRVLIPDLTDQLVEAGDAGVGCAVTEQLGSAHVPRREVTESAAPLGLMLCA